MILWYFRELILWALVVVVLLWCAL